MPAHHLAPIRGWSGSKQRYKKNTSKTKEVQPAKIVCSLCVGKRISGKESPGNNTAPAVFTHHTLTLSELVSACSRVTPPILSDKLQAPKCSHQTRAAPKRPQVTKQQTAEGHQTSREHREQDPNVQ